MSEIATAVKDGVMKNEWNQSDFHNSLLEDRHKEQWGVYASWNRRGNMYRQGYDQINWQKEE